MKAAPTSTKESLEYRLRRHARQRWPELADLQVRFRANFAYVDAVLPGRAREVRAMNDREMRLTSVIEVEIEEASAKVSQGPTDDDADDQNLAIWSGVVPARLVFGEPIPSTDGAMVAGDIEVPASLRRLLGR